MLTLIDGDGGVGREVAYDKSLAKVSNITADSV